MSLEGKKSVGPESIISHSGTEDDVIIKVEPVGKSLPSIQFLKDLKEKYSVPLV